MANASRTARYMVYWKARAMLADRSMHQAIVREIMQGGFSLDFPQTLPVGTVVNIEFYVEYHNKKHRIRAQTEVFYCLLRANSESAKLDVKILKIAEAELHLLNNILQTFSESKEINLRL